MTRDSSVVVLQLLFPPATETVSPVSSMKEIASAEMAVVGNEAVVEVGAFMDGGRAAFDRTGSG